MIAKMEQEMTKGRQGGMPNNQLDAMLSEISKASTDIVIQRKELLAAAQN